MERGTVERWHKPEEDIAETVRELKAMPKKRNGKFISFCLTASVFFAVGSPFLTSGINISQEILAIVMAVICSFIIVTKAEKGHAVKEWFRCLGVGLLVATIVALLFMGASIGCSAGGYNYVIKDENGNKIYAKQLGNGEYEDTNGRKYRTK